MKIFFVSFQLFNLQCLSIYCIGVHTKPILCLSALQEECRQLSNMLGCEIFSMLCVPVASRATGQVVALACAFNKKGGQRYKWEEKCVPYSFHVAHQNPFLKTLLSPLGKQRENNLVLLEARHRVTVHETEI